MGNQGSATGGLRRAVELAHAGVLGEIRKRFVRKPGVQFIDRYGNTSTHWCFSHVIHDETYLSFQVNRSEFDTVLLDNARRLGAEVHERTKVTEVDISDPSGVTLETLGAEGERQTHRARFVIDASGKVLGKVATAAADALTGKRKPIYTPFLDTGDHVIVINAALIHLSGAKESDKVYHRHTGYLGGLKSEAAGDVRKKQPQRLVEDAVRGMLPKTKLGEAMYRKLKVYAGPDHPHAAQKPSKLEVA